MSSQASLMMRVKPWCTHSSMHGSTTRIRCYIAFRRQCCSVCNVCNITQPGSSTVRENTTTSRQYCSICAGYRVCLLGDVWPSTVLTRETTNTTSNKSQTEVCVFACMTLPTSQTVTHGDRRFDLAASALWSGLPDSVRTAKTQVQYNTFLNTHILG